MPLDPRIPLGAQQFDMRGNALAAAQLGSQMQARQMNALQMQRLQEADAREKALRNALAGATTPEQMATVYGQHGDSAGMANIAKMQSSRASQRKSEAQVQSWQMKAMGGLFASVKTPEELQRALDIARSSPDWDAEDEQLIAGITSVEAAQQFGLSTMSAAEQVTAQQGERKIDIAQQNADTSDRTQRSTAQHQKNMESIANQTRQDAMDKPVTVLGNNGELMTVPYSESGKYIQATPGVVAYMNFNKEAATKDKALGTVTSLVEDMAKQYRQLDEARAIISTDRNTVSNVLSATQSSWGGQALGRVVGTDEQTLRTNIKNTMPLLINMIRKASEMGARGLDSEKELQFYLQAVTDPTQSIQANMGALKRLDKAYGLGTFKYDGEIPKYPKSNIKFLGFEGDDKK